MGGAWAAAVTRKSSPSSLSPVSPLPPPGPPSRAMGRINPISLRVKHLINWPSSVIHPAITSYLGHIFQDYFTATPHIRASQSGIYVNLTVLQTSRDPPVERHPKWDNPKLDFTVMDMRGTEGLMERRAYQARAGHFYYRIVAKNKVKSAFQKALDADGRQLDAAGIFRRPNGRILIDEEERRTLGLRRAPLAEWARVKHTSQMAEDVSDLLAAMGQRPVVSLAGEGSGSTSTSTSTATGAGEGAGAGQGYAISPDASSIIHLRFNVIRNPLLNGEILAQYVAYLVSRNVPLARIYRTLMTSMGKGVTE
ncbi:hypothetical protein M427DRAFT_142864 [Gonapodya prolifera JEL478]|uniref:Uncharacterized protein n=1 Tax=Gonapodya prolifera (strain JEL478) TaxID=1344416 RepID=A0A139ATC4_GONPJ|nr:hypothetical protein M427DRAFT_142864 [Gonapodya prolifera JEL478]|eukprot:KXS19981.1 hypothetical protein M427DRAFT_142864 [Gonapodya prolifera JEL478]